MNAEGQIVVLPTQAPPPQPETESLAPATYTHRGKGRIARLPKALRDQVNCWILDGVSYPEIIERLGLDGKDLNPGHLCEYRKRGYQDWLREREWYDNVASKSEFSKDLLTAPDVNSLHEAGLRMAAAQMLDQLMRFGAAANSEDAKPDPEAFARLVNALSRLTREALSLQKYQDACTRARAELQELKDPNRELNMEEHRAIVRRVDRILGVPSIDDPPLRAGVGRNGLPAGVQPDASLQPGEGI